MSEVRIHNGQVIGEFPGVGTVTAEPGGHGPSKPSLDSNLNPDEIARRMAQCISELQSKSPPATPMEIVNGLLQLQGESGAKMVWTRFDLFQCFGIWTRKLGGDSGAER